ncbi:MAG: carotenoid biosynthesis protein, partial [Bacteroidales bacterium]
MTAKLKIPSRDKIRSFLLSWYIIGFAGFAIPYSYDIFRQLISLSILLSVALMLVYHRRWTGRFIITAIIIFIFGWAIELLGTRTGFPFGHYDY